MKGIGMKKFSGICAAAAVVAATTLQGCILPTPLHTAEFGAGENNLQGKQLYFMPTPGDAAYQRTVVDITQLPNDPTGDTEVDFTAKQGGAVEVVLGLGNAVNFYGALIESIFIGPDGTIGMGEEGDNSSLTTHFSVKEVSLLPADDVSTGTVSYEVADGDFVTVTFDGVTAGGGAATAQAEFFINADQYGDIALSYETISTGAAGIVGLSNGPLAGLTEEEINQFLADFANQGPITQNTMTGTV